MYTIKLTQYAFDNTYTNARLFEDKAERDAYFDNLQGYTFNKDVNFIARDIIATDIDIKVEPQTPLFVLLNYNYCVIKNDYETLYFYIRKSEQLSGNLIRCRLENDIIQNYIYDAEFSDCMITNAHLNRFIDNGDNTVSFDGNVNSKLFEREELKDLSKRLVHREKLITKIDLADNSLFNKWVNENVLAWCYICCSYKADGYTFKNGVSSQENIILNYTRSGIENKDYTTYSHITLCYPIMKTTTTNIAFIDGNNNEFQIGGFNEFLELNNGYANIYTVKLSARPPFKADNYEYFVRDGIMYIQISGDQKDKAVIDYTLEMDLLLTEYTAGRKSGLLYIKKEYIDGFEMYLENNNILPQYTFNKNDIIGADRNVLYNPKLNGSDYKELQLSFIGTNQIYDMQKLNDSAPQFLYKEMVGADITKGNIKYLSDKNNNIFNEDYVNSYNGLSYTNDISLPIATNVFDEFLANNKNAFLSFQNTQELSNIKTFTSIIGNFGNLLNGNLGAATNIGTSIVNQAAQLAYEKAQFSLTIDNMKSAPQQLQNNNGNAIQALSISPLGFYIEIYEALPNELEIANDIMYDKGFIYNQYDNIKNHMYTRKYFNYIKANVENIKADLSNEIKLRMRQIFANGIKFWHTDDIIFNKENYERSLEANG